nr:energy transducer TonB [Halochromatium salexigens]
MTPADAPAPVDVSSVATEADIETSDRAQQVNQAPTNVTKARPEPKPELTQQSTASSPPSEPKAEPKRLTAVPKTANTRKQAERTQAPPARIASPVTSLDASREPNQSRNRAGSGSGDGGHSTGTTAGTGGGGEISANNYYGRLATWLARHKRYPAQARRLRQEGTVKVTFTVDNNGRVVSKRIAHSSGHDLLDREAQAMLERASPLPRIPASLRRSSLTITLPVAFNLR